MAARGTLMQELGGGGAMAAIAAGEAEVAETLALPEGTVKSRSARALERLRKSYD